ncbi:flagellar hook-basal body protein FliE [Rhodobacteraceae bacterium THAF1]|uniref:flagellar hook-basal body complex protein FliE n=1 Tax=Palleronia sp. THAF1 TaxID=2587842 RepID=UPI000F3CE9C2|nr:flagellar hook-basal body complex protein FliE [Palleronia sp. THAF1]QFU10289.1 flagellar hook-basal body protein FliE [Palleronia sp. THAF1]VDC16806.1 flagellar hook-basal body protein FliE [Rhodobacteraceae bacterium THAF1]
MDIAAAFAAQRYAAARPATTPDPAVAAATEAVQSFAETLQKGDDTARAAMTGAADPHALVQALGEAKFAVDTAVTVRNKVVEAYQEILRMPV